MKKRVGNRGISAAVPVTGRSWARARALRADPQRTAAVDPRNRAAAGADGMNTEHRQADEAAVEPGFGARFRRPVADQRHVVARAAHVDANHIAHAATFADTHRGRDTSGGAGKKRGTAETARQLGRGGAAVRLHHQ